MTSANIAARKETDTMSSVTSITTAETDQERERVKAIAKICGDDHSLFCTAVDEGWTIHQTDMEKYRSTMRIAPKSAHFGKGRAPSSIDDDILCAALLVRAGFEGVAEANYKDDRLLTAGRELSRLSTLDMIRETLRARGEYRSSMTPTELIRASSAMSTGSMPVAFGGSMEKIAIASFQDVPRTWSSFARVRSVNSFRTNTAIRPIWNS
jgi:hypothetical protein